MQNELPRSTRGPGACVFHSTRGLRWFLASLVMALLSAVQVQAQVEGPAGIDTLRVQPPIVLSQQGSIFVGGHLDFCPANDGQDPANPRFPAGQVVINQLYAEYQVPANRTFRYPLVLIHGGGHSGTFFDTTPDGREGWRTLLVRKGITAYSVDDPNRGRAGSDICDINLVRLGLEPFTELPYLNRYPAASAWVAFRWGPSFGVPYPNTQFPIKSARQYYAQVLTSYRDVPGSTEENDKIVAGLVALLDQIGPAILVGWSQGGLVSFGAAIQRPKLVKGIIAIEPAGFGDALGSGLDKIKTIPIQVVIGDNNATGASGAKNFADTVNAAGGDVTPYVLPEHGIFGNGHTMLAEKNNQQILEIVLTWLRAHVAG